MKSMLRSLAFAGAFTLAASSSALAQIIPVESYGYNTSPSGSYPDSGGTELTDGVALTIAWGSGVSIGYADVAPLAGWQGGNPDITFYFDGPVTIRSFTAWFADSDGHAGVYLPSSLTLSVPGGGFSQVFSVTNPDGNGSTVPLTFGGFEITTDEIRLSAVNPFNWVMISEVSFSGTPVPEPANAAGLAGVFASLWALAGRRRARASRAQA